VGGRGRPRAAGRPLIVDLDSTICPTYGPAKSGTAFGYTKVRGYHGVEDDPRWSAP